MSADIDDLRLAISRALEILEAACPGDGFVIIGVRDEGDHAQIETLDNLDQTAVHSLLEVLLETDLNAGGPPLRHRMH